MARGLDDLSEAQHSSLSLAKAPLTERAKLPLTHVISERLRSSPSEQLRVPLKVGFSIQFLYSLSLNVDAAPTSLIGQLINKGIITV